MTIGGRVDGSGSGLLNEISRYLLGRTEGYNDVEVHHVTPLKLVTKVKFSLFTQ
jgi:hypothetical protein